MISWKMCHFTYDSHGFSPNFLHLTFERTLLKLQTLSTWLQHFVSKNMHHTFCVLSTMWNFAFQIVLVDGNDNYYWITGYEIISKTSYHYSGTYKMLYFFVILAQMWNHNYLTFDRKSTIAVIAHFNVEVLRRLWNQLKCNMQFPLT